jgi:hypothetical protein
MNKIEFKKYTGLRLCMFTLEPEILNALRTH